MRKITCVQCGHEDAVEDVRYMLGKPGQAMDRQRLRELSAAIHRHDFDDAALLLAALFADEPLLAQEVDLGRFERRPG
ncbi:hypothetical protein [Sphingomonas hankookensis]